MVRSPVSSNIAPGNAIIYSIAYDLNQAKNLHS